MYLFFFCSIKPSVGHLRTAQLNKTKRRSLKTVATNPYDDELSRFFRSALLEVSVQRMMAKQAWNSEDVTIVKGYTLAYLVGFKQTNMASVMVLKCPKSATQWL